MMYDFLPNLEPNGKELVALLLGLIRMVLIALILAAIFYCGHLTYTELYGKEKSPESRIVSIQEGPELQRITKQALGLK